jgi:sugar lactone lactonase YvrE
MVLVAVSLAACGGARRADVNEAVPPDAPSALVVDTIIEGPILGQPLRAPYGAAVDFRGNLYLTEAGNHRLIRFTPDLVPRGEVGGFGGDAGLLDRPGFVTVDNGLTLLVADRGNLRLVRYNATLTYVNEISLLDFDDIGEFGEPSGVALSNYGEIWVADRDRNRLAVFDNVNKFERYIAEYGYSGGQVSVPEKLVETADGGFYVCDAGNGRISLYDQYGNYVRSLGHGKVGYVVAAAVDKSRGLWVLDGELGRLLFLTTSGRILFETSSQITGLDRPLKGATDIELLSDGRLLVVDSGNNRLIVCRILTNDQ